MHPRFLLTGLLLSASVGFGQNAFVALDGGTTHVVKELRNLRPLIEKGGKLEVTSADQFGFVRSTVYRPGLVTLTDFRVGTSHLETMNGDKLNYDLHIHGKAQSDTGFKKCFMVLEMTGWKTGGVAFAEVPDLPAGETVDLTLNFRLQQPFEEGSYRVHLFSDGIELLHTKLPAAYVASQKQKTDGLLSGKVQDFPPILAHRVNPPYPEALKKAGVSGSVKIRAIITKNGDVTSPELISATDPALGEAALATVVKWKFDPALKARKFVDAKIEIPIEFRPPKAEKR